MIFSMNLKVIKANNYGGGLVNLIHQITCQCHKCTGRLCIA